MSDVTQPQIDPMELITETFPGTKVSPVCTFSRRRRSCEERFFGASVVAIVILGCLGIEEISDPPKSSDTGIVVTVLVAAQGKIPISDEHARRIANIVSFLSAVIAGGT